MSYTYCGLKDMDLLLVRFLVVHAIMTFVIMGLFSLMLVPRYMTFVTMRMFSLVTIEGMTFVMFLMFSLSCCNSRYITTSHPVIDLRVM